MNLPNFLYRHTREGGYPYYQLCFKLTKAYGFPIKLGMTDITISLEQ